MTETTVGEGKEHRTVDSKQTDTDDRFMGTWHSKCPPPKKMQKNSYRKTVKRFCIVQFCVFIRTRMSALASEITYTVSSGALNSTPSVHLGQKSKRMLAASGH